MLELHLGTPESATRTKVSFQTEVFLVPGWEDGVRTLQISNPHRVHFYRRKCNPSQLHIHFKVYIKASLGRTVLFQARRISEIHFSATLQHLHRHQDLTSRIHVVQPAVSNHIVHNCNQPVSLSDLISIASCKVQAVDHYHHHHRLQEVVVLAVQAYLFLHPLETHTLHLGHRLARGVKETSPVLQVLLVQVVDLADSHHQCHPQHSLAPVARLLGHKELQRSGSHLQVGPPAPPGGQRFANGSGFWRDGPASREWPMKNGE